MKGRELLQAGEPAGAAVQRKTNPSHRILVVDDDSYRCRLSAEVLIRHGYEVNAAGNAAAAWEALNAGSYDLLITDNNMPRLTGIEMIERLRLARMTLPVIMATSYLPMNAFARKPWLTPDAMLQRPFSNEDLLAAVKNVLHTDDTPRGHLTSD